MGELIMVQLSGGVASWAAARLLVDAGERVECVFADTLIEDEDTYGFLDDCEYDLGVPVHRIAEGRNPWEVFRDRKFLGNTRVDPCSLVLKRELLNTWLDEHHPGGAVAIGIDWTESHRVDRISEGLAPRVVRYPLIEHNMDKVQAFDLLAARGIQRPRLYDFGFAHNNCGGFCIKAGQGQFVRLLKVMPERYAAHEQSEQELREFLGKDVAILRDRRGGTTTPMTMTELRLRVEAGESFKGVEDDIGGCGCALPGSPASFLTEQMVTITTKDSKDD